MANLSVIKDLEEAFAGSGHLFFNLSGICATTRIRNVKDLGLATASIRPKFLKHPNHIVDLPIDDFRVRQKLFRLVDRKLKATYEPILYLWELYAGVPDTHPGDIFLNSLYKYGGMVWADATFSRFLLVNVYGPNLNGAKGRATTRTQLRNEYTDATLFHANRFLNLVTYLAGTPKWVRATYITLGPEGVPDFDPAFLSNPDHQQPTPPLPSPSSSSSSASSPQASSPGRTMEFAPVLHLTPERMQPALQEVDFSYIDRFAGIPQNGGGGSGGGSGDRSRVLTDRRLELKPLSEACASCGKVPEALKQCAQCGSVQYCGRECQKAHWKEHKTVCKAAASERDRYFVRCTVEVS